METDLRPISHQVDTNTTGLRLFLCSDAGIDHIISPVFKLVNVTEIALNVVGYINVCIPLSVRFSRELQ